MKLKLTLTAALAFVVFSWSSSVLAQGSVAVSQSQFNSNSSGPWSFNWFIDGSIFFATNGQSSSTSASSQQFGNGVTTTIWNMAITFNNGVASVTASTDYASPVFNWNLNSPVSSLSPVTSLMFGVTYQANNNESASISDITYNGGVPVSGLITANGSQDFEGLLITETTPITSVGYTLTVSTPSSWQTDNDNSPALFSTLAIPGVTPVPEPSTLSMLGGGFISLAALMRFGKK